MPQALLGCAKKQLKPAAINDATMVVGMIAFTVSNLWKEAKNAL